MSQLSRVAKTLRKNTEGKGISAKRISSMLRIPRASVSKRIYDLRMEGKTVYTNTRLVNGVRTTFYKIAS